MMQITLEVNTRRLLYMVKHSGIDSRHKARIERAIEESLNERQWCDVTMGREFIFIGFEIDLFVDEVPDNLEEIIQTAIKFEGE